MRYLSVFRSPERNAPPSQQEMDTMGAMIHELMSAGKLLATEGCLPSKLGFRVKSANGKITSTDGPFTEAKEVIGGFALFEVESKEEMMQLTKRFLGVVGDGECEVRLLYEQPASDAFR
jgi:hypothetical protein